MGSWARRGRVCVCWGGALRLILTLCPKVGVSFSLLFNKRQTEIVLFCSHLLNLSCRISFFLSQQPYINIKYIDMVWVKMCNKVQQNWKKKYSWLWFVLHLLTYSIKVCIFISSVKVLLQDLKKKKNVVIIINRLFGYTFVYCSMGYGDTHI